MAEHSPPRRSPRFVFDTRLTVTYYDLEEKRELWGRTANISQSGLAATVSDPLDVGQVVVLRFALDPHPVQLRATVRFQQGHFCGFEFLVMSDDLRRRIRETCDRIGIQY